MANLGACHKGGHESNGEVPERKMSNVPPLDLSRDFSGILSRVTVMTWPELSLCSRKYTEYQSRLKLCERHSWIQPVSTLPCPEMAHLGWGTGSRWNMSLLELEGPDPSPHLQDMGVHNLFLLKDPEML